MGFRLSNRMTDAGYYRGTTADQDTRFGDKTKKLMKTLKFSDQLNEPVDMRKVKLDAMKPWIHEKLTEILGFEDDVVIDYAINQLEETNHPDPKAVQINLTGFLNAKNARTFMAELWPMLVSATKNPHGIPDKLIELKRQEMEMVKEDAAKMKKFQSNIENIQEALKKERPDEPQSRDRERSDRDRNDRERSDRDRGDRSSRTERKESRREDRDRRESDRKSRRNRSRSRSEDRKRAKRSRSRERKRSRDRKERKRRSRSRDRKDKKRRSRSRDRKSEKVADRSEEKRREKSKSKSREKEDRKSAESRDSD